MTDRNMDYSKASILRPSHLFHDYWTANQKCFCNELIKQISLREHAYSNTLEILPPKNESFQMKNSKNFHISAQNIDCGYSLEPPRRGGSNEYPQFMSLSRNKKIMYTPVNPSFSIYKWGLRGSKLYRYVFVMNQLPMNAKS